MNLPATHLFVPGDRPDRFAKALASGADRVILDLEDAVRPEAKPAARAAICTAACEGQPLVVRINDAASQFHAEDLACLAECAVSTVMLPKAETPEALQQIVDAAGRELELLPQIETVRGLEAVPALLAHPSVQRVAFGHLDFALDLGASSDWEALLYARSRLVALSRLAGGLPPIDSVTTDISDLAGLRGETRAAQRLGFGGKLLIHPTQVGPTAEMFRPSTEDIAWARRVLASMAEAPAGAAAIDGKMIDKPVEEAARRLLARAGPSDA